MWASDGFDDRHSDAITNLRNNTATAATGAAVPVDAL